MNKSKFRINSILIISAFVLFGCATAPMAPAENDSKAKTFETLPGKATLYVYRNERFGAAISMDVAINGKTIGQTASKTFFKFDLAPGDYRIDSKAENTSTLQLSLDAEKNYFVWQEVKMGIVYARSKLQLMDEEKGKQGVTESRLINSAINGEDIRPLGPETPAQATNLRKKLENLNKLRTEGAITQSEYEQTKATLLNNQ